jgi:hypothetical protein
MFPVIAKCAGLVGLWEAAWWARRRARRSSVYQIALQHAQTLNRPLVVVGAPDGGVTSGYGCGDQSIDLSTSTCPNHLQCDITTTIPIADDSCVVFVSCVLEYVDDVDAAIYEINRISGGQFFVVGVEPWTLTSIWYPGAKRTLPANLR